ncbi:MAG: hypothetical protein MI923_20945, partial [Phycisphaerales bacterium]|nr:hypothetical protein [Phycisphaerales bacterium]
MEYITRFYPETIIVAGRGENQDTSQKRIKELFSEKEIDHLFKTLVLPILTYGLAVYGASDSDLNVIQRFLDRCHRRHFTSQTVSIFNLLEQQDKSAFKRAINNHMLGAIITKEKELVYNFRRRRCHLPQIKTERYKKTS